MTEAERFFAIAAVILGVGCLVLGALLIRWKTRALEREALLTRYTLGTWKPRAHGRRGRS